MGEVNVRAPRREGRMAARLGAMCALLASSTAIGLGFHELGFTDSSIISLYILSTLLTATVTSGRMYTLLSSALSVVLYNFYFVVPRFSFESLDTSYLVTFAIMFVAAIVASELTSHIARNAREARRTAYRTSVLLETNQLLQQADDPESIARIALGQLLKLLNGPVAFYPVEGDGLGSPLVGDGVDEVMPASIAENARVNALRALRSSKLARDAASAGAAPATADALEIVAIPMGDGLFLPARTHDEVFGVVGIRAAERDIDSFELSIARSIIGECALELAREREAREREEAAVLARNEQLRANLLRSLGHDLRTPLTAISGAAAILRDDSDRLAPEQRRALLDDVYHDSLWLIDMVENLLTITHFDEGTIKLTLNSELIDDIFEAAVSHLANQAGGHRIVIEPAEEILLVRIDASLIIQVLTNLVGNAIKYTPAGSTIQLSARREGAFVRVTVADDGPGVADDDKPHVFDRFYSGAKAERPADAQRSFGLGLALCRSIVEAHGGAIEVHDNVPHGAVFSFTLPAEEVAIHG